MGGAIGRVSPSSGVEAQNLTEDQPMLFISEVRIKLWTPRDAGDPLRAYAKVVLNRGVAIQDLRVIEGDTGIFVSMPSHKIQDHCPFCNTKNFVAAACCEKCHATLDPDRAPRDRRGRPKVYADLVFPINQASRNMFNDAVIPAYYYEVMLADRPGYVCTYDEPIDHCDCPQETRLEFVLAQPNGRSHGPRLVWKGSARSPYLRRAARLSMRL
ncbi:MAG: hypothetical protein C5B53_11780 [Candidatus Melainabacteria bacterium]|nr:MAG: hypothetical protein C5B53_11780 [Candidatus Melainabacteria bacterium]